MFIVGQPTRMVFCVIWSGFQKIKIWRDIKSLKYFGAGLTVKAINYSIKEFHLYVPNILLIQYSLILLLIRQTKLQHNHYSCEFRLDHKTAVGVFSTNNYSIKQKLKRKKSWKSKCLNAFDIY